MLAFKATTSDGKHWGVYVAPTEHVVSDEFVGQLEIDLRGSVRYFPEKERPTNLEEMMSITWFMQKMQGVFRNGQWTTNIANEYYVAHPSLQYDKPILSAD